MALTAVPPSTVPATQLLGWDAVELWLTQLSFPLQVVLGVLVLLPACWGGAAAIDRLCDLAAARLDVRRGPGDG